MKKRYILYIALILVVLLLAGLLFFLSMLSSGYWRIGLSAYFYDTTMRIMAVFIIIAIIFGAWICLDKLKKEESKKQNFILGLIKITILCLGIWLTSFFVMPSFHDVSYFEEPIITYLHDLSFYDDTSGDNTTNYIEGYDLDGNKSIFIIDNATYDKGDSNDYHFAKISYLPNSKVVMNVEFLNELDQSFTSYLPHHDLNFDEILIHDTIYDIPMSMNALLEMGWDFYDEEDEKIILGKDNDPIKSDFEHIYLTNKEGERIYVGVCNLKNRDLPIQSATVYSFEVSHDWLDFKGLETFVNHDVTLYWSTKKNVLDAYGMPDETDDIINALTYHDHKDPSQTIEFEFDEDDYLIRISLKYHYWYDN